jgi:hypothetical protein
MSILEQAQVELAAANFGEDDSRVMLEILAKFFNQWDSGGAVAAVAPVLMRLLAGKPLGPLTGADCEWHDPMSDGIMLQNVRCSSVFKDWRMPDGSLASEAGQGTLTVHDIDNPSWDGKFPYLPDDAEIKPPIVEFG